MFIASTFSELLKNDTFCSLKQMFLFENWPQSLYKLQYVFRGYLFNLCQCKKRAVLFLFRQIKKCSHLNSTFVNIGDTQAIQHTFPVNFLFLLVLNSVFVSPMSTHSRFILFKCDEKEWIREVERIVQTQY
jgi:hypothetical protein